MPGNFAVQSANQTGTEEGLRELREGRDGEALFERLREPGSLLEVAGKALGLSAEDREYLAEFPDSVLEGVRAGVAQAIDAGRSLQVQFTPAYDFEVRLFEYGNAFVVSLAGPYPGQTYARDAYRTMMSKRSGAGARIKKRASQPRKRAVKAQKRRGSRKGR